jgi:hypothetical protein
VVADGIEHAWNPAASNGLKSVAGAGNKKGEPGFAFLMVVGADGVEPPTYSV